VIFDLISKPNSLCSFSLNKCVFKFGYRNPFEMYSWAQHDISWHKIKKPTWCRDRFFQFLLWLWTSTLIIVIILVCCVIIQFEIKRPYLVGDQTIRIKFSLALFLATDIMTDCKGFWRWCITLRISAVFGLCPSSGILKKKLESSTFRKLNLSPSSGEVWKTLCWVPASAVRFPTHR
jgi:hypothetical protein